MGQAKNRGSREERIKQAQQQRCEVAERLGLERRPLAEIKAEMGVPEDAVFRGYAVHIAASDEFLMEHRETRAAEARQWAKLPGLAKFFPAFGDAYQLARADRGEIVVGVFETATQFFVSEVA